MSVASARLHDHEGTSNYTVFSKFSANRLIAKGLLVNVSLPELTWKQSGFKGVTTARAAKIAVSMTSDYLVADWEALEHLSAAFREAVVG